MVKLIFGVPGSGKTKKMIELCNQTTADDKNIVICVERGQKLTFDISHRARLIDSSEYDIKSYQVLRGFITGLYAGNYDISHIFVDSVSKVAHNQEVPELEKFIVWAEEFGAKSGIDFVLSVTLPESGLTEALKKYV